MSINECTDINHQRIPHKLGTNNFCDRCANFLQDKASSEVPEFMNRVVDFDTEVTLAQAMRGQVVLDPNDPFDSVLIDMVNMNRKKRRDHAADTDIFSNFRDTARNLSVEGFGPAESAYVLLLTKVARLRSLRENGRMADPSNESVLDTYLDLAVYATIVLALVKEQNG